VAREKRTYSTEHWSRFFKRRALISDYDGGKVLRGGQKDVKKARELIFQLLIQPDKKAGGGSRQGRNQKELMNQLD